MPTQLMQAKTMQALLGGALLNAQGSLSPVASEKLYHYREAA